MTTVIDSVITTGDGLLVVTVGSYFRRRQGCSGTFSPADRTLGAFDVFGTTFARFFGTGPVFALASFGYSYGVGAFVLPGAAVIGFLLPIVFVLTTGNARAATVVGFVPTVVTVGTSRSSPARTGWVVSCHGPSVTDATGVV